MADTRQVVSWALERQCAFRSGDEWFLPARTCAQLADLRTVASAEGEGRIVNGICVTPAWAMLTTPVRTRCTVCCARRGLKAG